MKPILRRLLAGLVAGGVIFGRAGIASAQSRGDLVRALPPPGLAGPGQLGTGLDRLVAILTEEQRISFRKAMQAHGGQIRELQTKLRAAHQALLEAALNNQFDEAAVRRQALAVANLEAEMTVLRAKALSQIQPPLSPEQIKEAKSAPPPGLGRRGRRPELNPPPPEASPQRRDAITNRDENGLPPKP